eukprot:TRINITY_DN3813_c0_g7_i1.p1 TRINITY_DN3813_c0_g7~~TRINITY_DN3813_c0_g7_i1.p1  ORF type:complete len:188 (+),score=63.13 TRINITY_DN3813_c0_g7_i1:141-704(+)
MEFEEEKAQNRFKRPSVIPVDNVGDEHSYRPKKGITKRILEVGEGTLLPKAPSVVKVVYKGYVTSTKELFDSTDESAVEIALGGEGYPEGFVAGVESMRKGERSEIRMTRKYGYKEDKIPERLKDKAEALKGKGLTYEVKLVDATIKMDLNGDRKIVKTIIKEGVVGEVPNEADEVKGKPGITLSEY